MTFEETLEVLLGWVGHHVDVTVRAEATRPLIVAAFGGDLRRAEDTYEDLRQHASWRKQPESLMFEVGEAGPSGSALFFLDAEGFRGADWIAAQRGLEIRLAEVVLLIEPWPSGRD